MFMQKPPRLHKILSALLDQDLWPEKYKSVPFVFELVVVIAVAVLDDSRGSGNELAIMFPYSLLLQQRPLIGNPFRTVAV